MAVSNVNVVVITGNLTRDPELRHTLGGTAICELRIAVNTRRKDGQTGEWVDKPNYFNVTVWGNQGVACSEHLAKGKKAGIEGRLDWSEWKDEEGNKRQAVQIIANKVEFLTPRDESEKADPPPQSDVPSDTSDSEAVAVGAGEGEDDIPF